MFGKEQVKQVKQERVGRPKDRSKDIAVLETTIRLLAEVGLAGLSMDRVAAEAGVSKVTVYTRWPTKNDMIAAALRHARISHVPEPTGSVRDDLIAHLIAMHTAYDASGGMALLGNCLADEPVSGELIAIMRRSTILPRRAGFTVAVREGINRGEIRPDLDPERVTSMVIGVMYADHAAGLPMGDGWEAKVVDDVLSGAARRD